MAKNKKPMADFKQCEFFLLRYIPDVVKGEFVNVGVVLLEEAGDGYTGVRVTRDWRRVRCIDPDADIELLESYEPELQRLLESRLPEIINYRSPMARRDWLLGQMEQSFSGALELAPMRAVLTESPAAELGRLAHTYLESAARGRRAQSGRRVVYNAMRGAFEQAGVWPFMRTQIAVSEYTRDGDPLKIDCGYRPNGVLHLFHALSLGTDVDSAKVLAYSFGQMQDGLVTQENEESTLTAVTEDNLDSSDAGIAFALATFEKHQIEVASLSQMPALAERARAELKL
jgi:hypothetical protein